MSSFTLQARYALLTYAQCGALDPSEVGSMLDGLQAEYIIGRESHADGGTHLHCFVDFGRRFRSRRTDIFDVGGHHPNISASRGKPEEGYDYAIKDGCIVGGTLIRPEPTGKAKHGIDWSILLQAKDRDEFLSLAQSHAPGLFWRSFNSLYAAATWYYRVPEEPYVSPSHFQWSLDEYPELVQWQYDAMHESDVSKLSCPSLRLQSLRSMPTTHRSTLRGPLARRSASVRGRKDRT